MSQEQKSSSAPLPTAFSLLPARELYRFVTDRVFEQLKDQKPHEEWMRVLALQPFPARVAWLIWEFESDLFCDGLDHYLTYDADCAFECVDHLRLVGADKVAGILENALDVANRDRMPIKEFREFVATNEIAWLFDWDDSSEPEREQLHKLEAALYALDESGDEPLVELVATYLRSHEAELEGF